MDKQKVIDAAIEISDLQDLIEKYKCLSPFEDIKTVIDDYDKLNIILFVIRRIDPTDKNLIQMVTTIKDDFWMVARKIHKGSDCDTVYLDCKKRFVVFSEKLIQLLLNS